MKKTIFTLLIIILNVLSIPAQKPDWFVKLQKLQKFPSSEKNVQKFFNMPEIIYSSAQEEIMTEKEWGKTIKYKLPEGIFSVFYSTGKCSKKKSEGYGLEDGIIISYSFQLNKKVPISLLNLHYKDFEIYKADDTAHIIFDDLKRGVRYTSLDENLQRVNYSTPDKYLTRCKDLVKQ